MYVIFYRNIFICVLQNTKNFLKINNYYLFSLEPGDFGGSIGYKKVESTIFGETVELVDGLTGKYIFLDEVVGSSTVNMLTGDNDNCNVLGVNISEDTTTDCLSDIFSISLYEYLC